MDDITMQQALDLLDESPNQVDLVGTIIMDPSYSHEIKGEYFYKTAIEVRRLSGQSDILPVVYSDRSVRRNEDIVKSSKVAIKGSFRSRNELKTGRSKLVLYIHVDNMDIVPESTPDLNSIKVKGYICKPTVYRSTPANREITDFLLAINRTHSKKSDYLPGISWGRNARFMGDLKVGDKIAVEGRVQSRNYIKKLPDGTQDNRIAYEISASFIMMLTDEFV